MFNSNRCEKLIFKLEKYHTYLSMSHVCNISDLYYSFCTLEKLIFKLEKLIFMPCCLTLSFLTQVLVLQPMDGKMFGEGLTLLGDRLSY